MGKRYCRDMSLAKQHIEQGLKGEVDSKVVAQLKARGIRTYQVKTIQGMGVTVSEVQKQGYKIRQCNYCNAPNIRSNNVCDMCEADGLMGDLRSLLDVCRADKANTSQTELKYIKDCIVLCKEIGKVKEVLNAMSKEPKIYCEDINYLVNVLKEDMRVFEIVRGYRKYKNSKIVSF